MTAIPTPFGSAQSKFKFMGSSTLVNCFPEIQSEGGKARMVILPCAGMTEHSSWSDTPCRGMIYLDNLGYAIAVNSGGAWRINEGGGNARWGTVPGIDLVSMCRNQKSQPQTVIRCDAGIYVAVNGVIEQLFIEHIEGCVWVESQGGYIIYAMENGRFYISSLNEATEVSDVDFATAEQVSDKLRAVKARGDGILLMGEYSTEFWRNTGNADFPFEPLGGATSTKGVLAPNATCDFDNSIVFVGQSKQGDRYVYRMEGYQPIKISTAEIDRLIAAETSPENIEGMAFSLEGHSFYTITGEFFTATYDAATKVWHFRKSYQQLNWRARCCFSAWNKIIVGDRLGGKTYYLDTSSYIEDDQPMIWDVITPTMQVFPHGFILDALNIDMLTGQGTTTSTSQGFTPMCMLRVSKDGGNTYGSERQLNMGKQGRYDTRVKSRRHGKIGPQGAVFKLSISDPVGRGLAMMDAQVRPLARP